MHVQSAKTLKILITYYKIFDIIALSETRIIVKTSLTYNIKLNNQFYETNPAEPAAGGTLLYISISLSCNPHFNLSMHKKNQLESTFIKIY